MPRSLNGMMQGTHSNHDRLTTIQQTHKRIKFKVLLSALMFWFGVYLFATASTPDDLKVALLPMSCGAICFVPAKSAAWRHPRLIIRTYNRQHRRNRA
jgi:hypothetical protein